jgi:hypothetical protein
VRAEVEAPGVRRQHRVAVPTYWPGASMQEEPPGRSRSPKPAYSVGGCAVVLGSGAAGRRRSSEWLVSRESGVDSGRCFSGSYIECCQKSENGAKIYKIFKFFKVLRKTYAVGESAARRRFGGTPALSTLRDSRPTPGVPAYLLRCNTI